VLEGMAEYYSAELSQKVKRNLKLNAEKGLFNGGYAPLGYKTVTVDYGTYKKKKLEIDPETAPIVKEIFEMRANDTNIMDIVDYLNSKGIKTVKGKAFKKTSLQGILKNKRYIGTNIYSGMEFPNTIPAIIDKELFDKVQEIIDKHKYAPSIAKAKEEYILTTKLFCGNCKEMMTGTCGKSSGNGIIYRYYICNGIKKKKCKKKTVPKYLIEDCVIEHCKKILTQNNIDKIAKCVYNIVQKENFENHTIKLLKKEQKKIKNNIENLMIAMEEGQNLELINERLIQRKKELREITINIDAEEKKLYHISENHIKFFLENLKNGNLDDIKYRKILINLFVNRIYLYDDNKITIIFNVGNASFEINTVLLKEVNTNLNNAKSLFLNDVGQPNLNH
jgi:hypothetical protein